jgi:N-acyl-D-amino-acid deacylase
MAADLVLFDEAKVADPSTFSQPHQYAAGFSYVIVGGVPVLDDEKMTAERPGVALRGAGADGKK